MTEKLVEIVLEGWIKKVECNVVTIEVDYKGQTIERDIPRKDFKNEKLPKYGRAIKYTLFIEYDSDNESDLDQDNPSRPELPPESRLSNISGKPGVYELDLD
jgi:hypothetical protein